jgi:hypothetical protein
MPLNINNVIFPTPRSSALDIWYAARHTNIRHGRHATIEMDGRQSVIHWEGRELEEKSREDSCSVIHLRREGRKGAGGQRSYWYKEEKKKGWTHLRCVQWVLHYEWRVCVMVWYSSRLTECNLWLYGVCVCVCVEAAMNMKFVCRIWCRLKRGEWLCYQPNTEEAAAVWWYVVGGMNRFEIIIWKKKMMHTVLINTHNHYTILRVTHIHTNTHVHTDKCIHNTHAVTQRTHTITDRERDYYY